MTQTLRDRWRMAPRLIRVSVALMTVAMGIATVVVVLTVLQGESPVLTLAWLVVALAAVVWFATEIVRGRLWAMLALNMAVALALGLSVTDLALSMAGSPMFGWPAPTALLNIPAVAAAALLWLPGVREHFVPR